MLRFNAYRYFSKNLFLRQCRCRREYTHTKPTENSELDLIFEVLDNIRSQREAQSYIRRFAISPIKPPKAASIPTVIDKAGEPIHAEKQQQLKKQEESTIPLQKSQLVDLLFTTRFEHVALIKIQGPFATPDLKSIAKTLVHLQKLGLMSIVILDNDEWKEMIKEGPARFKELKDWMMEDAAIISEAIENAGGRTTSIYDEVFTLTNNSRKGLTRRTLATDVGAKINVSLCWLRSCLNLGKIPLILPIAVDGLSIQRTISANAGMIELSCALSNQVGVRSLNLKTPELEPMRIIVINSEGGIPSEERRGSHVFINIQQEYDDIKQSYKVNPQWHFTHPTGLENLEMIKTCLERLPSTTSAIMVPAYSPTGLISNLITDKPLFSSSLPLTASTTPSTTTTVLRYGAPVSFHNSLSTINIPSLQTLIEASFGRRLDVEEYLERLENCLETVIVTGDYQGAAIITMEDVKGMNKGDVPYLDKFAVAPSAQGIGIADILWKQIQIKFPNLMWRSRDDNGINKWYFERSDGNFRVSGTHWVMFWYGSEGINKLHDYSQIIQNLQASFLPNS